MKLFNRITKQKKSVRTESIDMIRKRFSPMLENLADMRELMQDKYPGSNLCVVVTGETMREIMAALKIGKISGITGNSLTGDYHLKILDMPVVIADGLDYNGFEAFIDNYDALSYGSLGGNH